jgi:hypothetical protein
MEVKVTQGLITVTSIELLHDTDTFIVYCVHTREKRPEVVSWGLRGITLLPAGFEWSVVKPSDYTVIQFPEQGNEFMSVYQEDRNMLWFIQFKSSGPASIIWESNV